MNDVAPLIHMADWGERKPLGVILMSTYKQGIALFNLEEES